MAVQLCLKDKATGAFVVGSDFIALDLVIAKEFDGEPHPVHWFENWMNTIGFALALGKSFEDVRKTFSYDPETVAICDWMNERFTNESYGCR